MTAVPESEPLGPITFDEFLAFEETGELKHELVVGFLYPWGETDPASGLAGASRRHNRIGFRIARLLGEAADRADCDVFGSDMLLRISDRLAYYPDVQLVCDPTDQHERYTERPCLIVEVLARRTARLDRGEKLTVYRRIPTLRAYLIVHQDRRLVERHWRDDEDAAWSEEDITSGEVPTPCINTALSLQAIYARSLP
jgi:Uma2 family endonuclease